MLTSDDPAAMARDLAAATGISEAQASELLSLIGMNPSSLLFQARQIVRDHESWLKSQASGPKAQDSPLDE